MNQINPNLKTLGQMINMNDFCDWFFNSNSNILTGGNPINIFVQNNISINSIPVYYFNCPALVQYWSNLNQFTNLTNNWTYLFTNLLGSIYQLFENVYKLRESSLTDKLVTGKQNPVGVIAILNHHYGYNGAGTVQTVANNKLSLNDIKAVLSVKDEQQPRLTIPDNTQNS